MSSLVIRNIASVTCRTFSGSASFIMSTRTEGMTCQDSPYPVFQPGQATSCRTFSGRSQ